MLAVLPLLLFVQQAVAAAPSPPPVSPEDTVGYWQQRIAYRIVARLDERQQDVHATGTLHYVNRSPDTLRVMYFHQYLNAFRPGSRWSAVDEREGRVRFQHLRDPDYGYERFTSVPTFDGTPVAPVYPLAPDSTVVRFVLPRTLAPGDSIDVAMAWDARPSATVYRRQGRRGREYDLAQWYPKVAVYDRGGWEENPFVPSGELYGEFGTYDVTLLLPADQVVAASGVPVQGDPGWQRVRDWGTVDLAAHAYGDLPPDTSVAVPDGYRLVRFVARDVHHFAWTVSPSFRYEGTLYRGRIPIHVLYDARSAARWGHGQAVGMLVRALQWLESIYGPYAYPQLTGTERIEGGATEFPMMVMYGSISPGLALHETGHMYSYGLLANNEWRSGWMDEGLTSYQSEWAQKLTRPERARGEAPAAAMRTGYRARAALPAPLDRGDIEQFRLDLLGRAQPIGTPGYAFSEFGIYNQMVYGRASMMYGALRDVVGDSAFTRFLHDYYARWKFKHVDEMAMRGSAERASSLDLGWFFDQWVHHTGLVDYALRGMRVARDGEGWLTRVRVVRVGAYRHPMPVGVLTSAGWTTVRADAGADDQWVSIHTAERPLTARLDPQHLTPAWDRRDEAPSGASESGPATPEVAVEWPFLDQSLADRELLTVGARAWYTAAGGVTPALRLATNYQGWLDRWTLGVAVAPRSPDGSHAGHLQGWVTAVNPNLPFRAQPAIGLRLGIWALDGVAAVDVSRRWDLSPFIYANGPRSGLTLDVRGTMPYDTSWMDPRRWDDARVADARLAYDWRSREPSGYAVRAAVAGGLVAPRDGTGSNHGYSRADIEGSGRWFLDRTRSALAFVRLYGAASDGAPAERGIGLSALDATDTFSDDLLRGRGAPLARGDVHYLALGDAAVRGYAPDLRLRAAASGTAALAVALNAPRGRSAMPRVWLSAFGDGARGVVDSVGAQGRWFADAGLGLTVRGMLYDKAYTLRLDVPMYVRRAGDLGGPVRWVWGFSREW